MEHMWAFLRRAALAAVMAVGAVAATAGSALAGDVTVVTEEPQLARQVFSLVNSYRASLGLSPLAWDESLAAAAAWHARWLASRCPFVEEVDGDVYRLRFADGCRLVHDDGLGRGPGERAAAFGFPRPWAVGENIASSWGRDPAAALRQWQESPGHDANQRRPDYALAGAGTVCIHYTGSVFVLQRPSFCFYVINFALGENQGAGEVEQPQPASSPNQASSGPTSAPGPTPRAGSGVGADQGATAGDPCVGRKVAPAPEEMVIYRVAPGDTLAALAARFLNDPQRYCDLAAWNDIRAPYWLQVGQELKVPAPADGDVGSERVQEERQQQEARARERTGEETPASEEVTLPEEEHGSDVLAVGGAEDGQGRTAEVAREKKGGGHPVLSFIGRLLRRLRELWPFGTT
jgi:uncharacterized protein YkwD/LysM repeat protein